MYFLSEPESMLRSRPVGGLAGPAAVGAQRRLQPHRRQNRRRYSTPRLRPRASMTADHYTGPRREPLRIARVPPQATDLKNPDEPKRKTEVYHHWRHPAHQEAQRTSREHCQVCGDVTAATGVQRAPLSHIKPWALTTRTS